MELTPQAVDEIALECLFTDDEIAGFVPTEEKPAPDGAVVVDAIVNKMAFVRERVEKNREKIGSLLDELPTKYAEGASFLEACYDRHGNQWTGMQRTMASLFALGQAIGRVTFCAPREFWPMLPGGMPYLFVHATAIEVAEMKAVLTEVGATP